MSASFLPTRRTRRFVIPTVGAAALVATMVAVPGAASADDPDYTVVATGLDNPRHLSVGPGNALYVAEAGRGGDGPCMIGAEGNPVCFGLSGAITRVDVKKGTQDRVLEGLPSLAEAASLEGPSTGGGAAGPQDVVTQGAKRLVLTIGLGNDPEIRTTFPELADMGTLRSATVGSSHTSLVADIAQHEGDTNPVPPEGAPDSNPDGFTSFGSGWIVADAGGNSLVQVSKGGATDTYATFDNQLAFAPPFLELPPGTQIPAQAVPTSVVAGPGGALYVSQLTGFPFEQGLANIYKVDKGGNVSVYASGLTNVTDLAFGPGNVLYAVQIADQGLLGAPIGSVVAIPNGGGAATPVVDGLFAPYGIAIQGKTAYVTTGSVAPGGEVIAVPLH